jgi:D-sedoheptulose 7-phosphate isomerase
MTAMPENDPFREDIVRQFRAIADSFLKLESEAPRISAAAMLMIEALRTGNKVLFCGNGGSAADSQHLAAELMGRYLKDRKPLPALALTVDTSALTAIANDYGYENVFARQLRGIGVKGDVLIGLSTSGNSPNVLKAASVAREMGIKVVAFTGGNGGKLAAIADVTINVPAVMTNNIQEMHIAIGHMLCGFVEAAVC